MEKSSLNREKETLNKDIEFSYEKAKAIVKDNEILLKEKKERAYEEATKWYEDVVDNYKEEYLNTMEEMSQKASATISEKAQTIKTLEHNLLRLQSIVQAATKANQRAQQELEKKNYYRIQITDLDVQEIKKIREIESYLRDTTPLNKVIWSAYYQNPCSEMLGRVVGPETKTGIYKITNMNNGMAYIGQSTNIATRWKSHIKRGIGADAPTRNKLYPAMLREGVENFTFEIVEECLVEELDERERFWIDYFQTKDCGYNVTAGNKDKEN